MSKHIAQPAAPTYKIKKHVPNSETLYIQTFLPTNEYYEKISVLEVHNDNDLSHPKLGISDIRKRCMTCNESDYKCPGHWGHISLPLPIWRIHTIKRAFALLQSFCFYCLSPKISIKDVFNKNIRLGDQERNNIKSSERLEHLANLTKSIKHCPQCAKPCVQFFFEHDNNGLFIRPVVVLSEEDYHAWRSQTLIIYNSWSSQCIPEQSRVVLNINLFDIYNFFCY